MTYYTHPQEVWDEKKCEWLARHRRKDGYGSKGPKGIVCDSAAMFGPLYGRSRSYNGGTVINGEWYSGEEWPLPQVPEGWEFVTVPSWGLRIQRKE